MDDIATLGCTDIKANGTEIVYSPNGTADMNTWLFSDGNMEVTATNGSFLHSIKFSQDVNITGNVFKIEAIRVAFVFGNGGAQYRTLSSIVSCDGNTSFSNNDVLEKEINLKSGWNLFSLPIDIQIQANDISNYFNSNSLYWTYMQKTEQTGHLCRFDSDTHVVFIRTVMSEMIRTLLDKKRDFI